MMSIEELRRLSSHMNSEDMLYSIIHWVAITSDRLKELENTYNGHVINHHGTVTETEERGTDTPLMIYKENLHNYYEDHKDVISHDYINFLEEELYKRSAKI